MSKIVKISESGSVIPGNVSVEYGINWKYSVDMTKDQINSSNIDFNEVNKNRAWELFLNELGLYSMRRDLCVLSKTIKIGDTRSALDLLEKIQEKLEKIYEN